MCHESYREIENEISWKSVIYGKVYATFYTEDGTPYRFNPLALFSYMNLSHYLLVQKMIKLNVKNPFQYRALLSHLTATRLNFLCSHAIALSTFQRIRLSNDSTFSATFPGFFLLQIHGNIPRCNNLFLSHCASYSLSASKIGMTPLEMT